MNKTLSRFLQLISFIWLIHSPLIFQTVNADHPGKLKRTPVATLLAAAPLIAACSPFQQIVIAILLDIDVTLDLVACGFAQVVIDILRSCPKAEWINIAVSLQLTAVVDIAVKFKAIAVVYPLLTNVVGAIAGTVDSACVTVFAQILAASPVLAAILDVRANVQLSTLFSRYGCLYSPAYVNLCLIIQLSLFLNPAFIAVCASLFASLSVALTTNVLPVITNCLIAISVHLNLVLLAVLSIVGGLLNALVKITTGLVFPCVLDVLLIISPSCPCASQPQLFSSLYPNCATCKSYAVPFPALQPAKCVFDLISLC
jgi:hypothetical protein